MPSLSASTPVQAEVWFEDGNLVLEAEASGVQFKVHQGVLASNSVIFADMFKIARPDSGDLGSMQCPVVVMHDDAKDLEYVLRALYDLRCVLADAFLTKVV
jgi:hypothetical protein